MSKYFIVLCLSLLGTGLFCDEDLVKGYLQKIFSQVPSANALWVTGELKNKVTHALGQAPSKMREKYWTASGKTVFVLEQIGKIKPITVAWTVENLLIQDLEVLVYRESRGNEVSRNFFTQRFIGVGLDEQGELDSNIDGISGATLSVAAMKRMARQALVMAKEIP